MNAKEQTGNITKPQRTHSEKYPAGVESLLKKTLPEKSP